MECFHQRVRLRSMRRKFCLHFCVFTKLPYLSYFWCHIQCAYSVKENFLRGLLVTPRANAIPPKYINIIYKFCLARHKHDVWIAAVPESCRHGRAWAFSICEEFPRISVGNFRSFSGSSLFLPPSFRCWCCMRSWILLLKRELYNNAAGHELEENPLNLNITNQKPQKMIRIHGKLYTCLREEHFTSKLTAQRTD